MTTLDILRALREDAKDVQNHIVAGVMPESIDTILCAIETLIADEEAKTADPLPERPYSVALHEARTTNLYQKY